MNIEAESLTSQQRHAAERCLAVLKRATEARQIVLAGYAGTGKTFTTGAIVRALLAADRRVCVLAPTHKALSQVRERLPPGVATYTIHQGLALRMRRDDNGEMQAVQRVDKKGKLVDPPVRSFDCIIVDEASMVGESLYGMLQVAAGARPILWIGDPAQLPPVNDGEDSPVWSLVSEQVRLTEIVRQKAGSGIARASMMVRQAIEDRRRVQLRDLREFEGDEIVVMPGGPLAVAETVAGGIGAGLDCRAIAYTNKATLQLCDMVHKMTHPPGAHRYSPGDPVVFARQYGLTMDDAVANNTETRVTRVEGEAVLYDVPIWKVETDRIGVVNVPQDLREHADRIGAVKAELRRANKAHQKAPNRETRAARDSALSLLGLYQDGFADLRHTYASTAHKAQGSTYDAAVLHWSDLEKMRDAVTFNRAVYVALTRPSQYLCIVGG